MEIGMIRARLTFDSADSNLSREFGINYSAEQGISSQEWKKIHLRMLEEVLESARKEIKQIIILESYARDGIDADMASAIEDGDVSYPIDRNERRVEGGGLRFEHSPGGYYGFINANQLGGNISIQPQFTINNWSIS